jgi:zinc finger SWIM domain-containing protein 3
MDYEEQIANIFWFDSKMIMDYAHFGDVVSFKTTFRTNKESMPYCVFVGFNHFRETVVAKGLDLKFTMPILASLTY